MISGSVDNTAVMWDINKGLSLCVCWIHLFSFNCVPVIKDLIDVRSYLLLSYLHVFVFRTEVVYLE